MIRTLKKMFVHVLLTAFVFVGFTQTVQAALIGTEQMVVAGAAQQQRAKISIALDRPEVQAQLEKLGISPSDAQARIAALSDAEAASIAHQMETLPAGGDGFLGALLFIFILLLVTDILGLTKVFPFTRSARH